MTTTPLDYFDKVPGTLEQLVLGVITQKLINRDYIHESLQTDFTTNAIDYNVTADSDEKGVINANLVLSLTFPTLPYDRQLLTDADSYDRRIMSINSLNIDTLSLPQKASYPLKSTPPQLPGYLSIARPENILERRLIAICLHIRNYLNWIDRWNLVANYWILATYDNQISALMPLSQIEADRDALLLELANGITFKPVPSDIFIGAYPTNTPPVVNPGTAIQLIEFFDGAPDPANIGSPLSSSLLDSLVQAANSTQFDSGGFSPNNPDSQTSTPTESPSLPNC